MIRKEPIVDGETYHVFNRGIGGYPIFSSVHDYYRFLDLVGYYRFLSPLLRFSFFKRLPVAQKRDYFEKIRATSTGVEIFSYCLMPNHYHFLVKNNGQDGVKKFIGNLQNSYAKYFNIKYNRNGSLFQEMFKATRIEDDEQFIHVARYIHLNPLTSNVVKNEEALKNYPWSSFGVYLSEKSGDFLSLDFLLSFYRNKQQLERFTLDQADYQKKLRDYRHLAIELDRFTGVSS